MDMKIALVHDMLVQEGGQERVLRALQKLFPESPTFVLIYDREKKEKFYPLQDVRSTFLQNLPAVEKKYQWYLPLMSTAIESHNLKDFDLIFSSSSSFAKGVLVHPPARHLCYCHTPTRYLWSDWRGYVEDLPYPAWVKKILPFYLSQLRRWDFNAAQRVDHFLANSQTVKERIKRYYGRSSEVIYPPVEVDKFYISSAPGNFYLAGGRLVPYKRYDLVVRAFNKLNLPLKIFGVGPEMKQLKQLAKPNIEFLGYVTDEEKARLFADCLAFINPQEEDFGMTMVEAMAAGRPVIAFRACGALEIVKAGETGVFFDDQEWEDLANTIIHFDPAQFNPQLIRGQAQQFSPFNFQNKIKAFLESLNLKI